jgi:hypothetical protein
MMPVAESSAGSRTSMRTGDDFDDEDWGGDGNVALI